MGMIVKIKKLLRMFVLLLIPFSVIVFSGCGKPHDPPPGAVLTIKALTPATTIGPPASGPTLTSSYTRQSFRVLVTDGSGNELDNVKVFLLGQFESGENISFAGVQTTQPAPSILSSVTTGNYGIKDFIVSALTFTTAPISDVTGLTTTPSSGGILLAGVTYDYSVTAVDSVGQETKAATISQLMTTPTCTNTSCGLITITWIPVQRASGYNVYGRTAGSEGRMTATQLSNTTFTFTDHGTEFVNTTVPPPGVNNSGVSLNPVKGTITATSGPLISTVDVAF